MKHAHTHTCTWSYRARHAILCRVKRQRQCFEADYASRGITMCLNMQICSILCSVIAGEDRNGKTENGKEQVVIPHTKAQAGAGSLSYALPARTVRHHLLMSLWGSFVSRPSPPHHVCVCVSVCSDRELDWCNKIRCIIYTYSLHTLAFHLVASSRISDQCKKRL